MPDIESGVEQVSEVTEDVNTDAGFNAQMAQQVGRELPPETRERLDREERSIEHGLEVEQESSGRQRDPDTGRFAPSGAPEPQTEEAPPADEETPEQEAPEPPVDWQERYRELEKLQGRQAQEWGERLARLEGRLESQGQTPQTPQQPTKTWTDEEMENVLSDLGGMQLVMRVAETTGGDETAIEDAIDVWEEFEPRAAKRYRRQYYSVLEEQEGQQQPEPQAQPTDPVQEEFWLAQRLQRATVEVTKDMSADQRKALVPYIPAALEGAPSGIRKQLGSNDPAEQQEGMAALVKLAQADAVLSAQAKARADAQPAATAAKQAAALGTGSQRPSVAAERSPDQIDLDSLSSEERAKVVGRVLHKQLMETETTDVSSGITYG